MSTGRQRESGFGYVGLMVAVVIFGLGSVGAARILASSERGEREAELLFIGQQFRTAIRTYYESGPIVGQFPPALEDLLLDRRVLTPRRHLRRIFPDPMTGSSQWGLVRSPQGGIMGVYSLSERTPMKQGNFDTEDADLLMSAPPLKQSPVANIARSSLQPMESTIELKPVRDANISYQDWKFVFRPPALTLKTVRPAESGGGS